MKMVRLFLCLFPALASAIEIPEKEWECERLDDDHVVIHNSDQSRRAAAIDPETEGDIVVPSTLRSMQVVSIGEKAFYNCSKLTSVTIPEGVTNIADYAFRYCTSLTNVVFPTSLKSIGSNAFQGCSKLSAANFTGASLTIGTHAFRDCSGIRELSFSGDLLSIGEYAFSGCTGLLDVSFDTKSVHVGKCTFSIYSTGSTILSQACTSLTNLLIRAADAALATVSFSGCTALRTVEVSAQSLSVGERAFSKYNYCSDLWTSPCSSLDSLIVTVDTSTLTVGASSFASCGSLTNAVLNGSESATIGESAFSDCLKLRSVELPTALEDVAKNAFCRCTSLGEISFATNLTHISYRAFDTCISLKSVELPEGLTGIDAQAFYGCSSIANLVFPQSLASVGDRAFEQCGNIGNVVFSEGDTNLIAASSVSIGERAFYECPALTNVVLSQAVSSLGSRAFSQCESLSSVNIPTNFSDLAESTFEDCAALSSIDLPVTLESIGNTVFYGCTNLTDFLIPTQNVVSIGAKAFKNTKYWNDYPDDLVVNNGYILGFKNDPVDVTLPDGCKAIPVSMFEGMTTLKSVTIPGSVTEIGARAFTGCSGITNLVFANVSAIGNSAFEGCTSLLDVTMSESLAAIPGNCFKDCTSLLSVSIPDAVASIGEYAFCSCASLTNVTGGAGVGRVGDYAFAYCVRLQPFEFPNDVAYGVHVFQGCTWTEHVLFPTVGTLKDEYPASYMNITSVVFSSSMTTITNGACAGGSSLASIRIPSGVTAIGALAFDGCTSLTSVVLSATVTDVATNAFAGCSGIVSATVTGAWPMRTLFPASYAQLERIAFTDGVTSLCTNFMSGCRSVRAVEIPQAVASIGASAFQDCAGLSAVELPTNLTSVAQGAFSGCTGLTGIVLPEGVTSVDGLAFDGCTSLASVVLSATVTDVATNAFVGCSGIVSATVTGKMPMRTLFPASYAQLEQVAFTDGVTSLCSDFLAGCGSIRTIDIPETVTSIGASAFQDCTGLSAVELPTNLTSIAQGAFSGCTGLTAIVLPEGVVSVGELAFDGCTSLASVVLSATVTDVATNAFVGCSGIASATVTGDWPMRDLFPASYARKLKRIALTGEVNSLCANFLAGCASIRSIKIPETVTEIEESAFCGCTGLSSLALPTNLVVVADDAFAGCTGLTSVTLPDGVESVGERAFAGCTALGKVTMAASVADVGTDAFRNCTSLSELVVSGQFPLWPAMGDASANLQAIGIAADATSLCDDLFSNCVALASVEIPWRVTEIGARAFYGCARLTDVVIPEYVATIGEQAFGNCKALQAVNYLCGRPGSVSATLYAGTRGSMMSRVLVQLASWQTTTNGAGAATLPSEWCERPIVWWGSVQQKLATVRFSHNTNWGGGTNLYFLADAGREVLELPGLPTHPFNTNLVCTGWYTAANGGEKVGDGLPVTGSATYYAHWVKWNELECLVTWNANGGAVSPSSSSFVRTTTLRAICSSAPTPTRAGWTFGGWCMDSDCAKLLAESSSLDETLDGDTTLYAKWTENVPVADDSVRVTWNANGGTVSPASSKFDGGTTVRRILAAAPTPKRTGWIFVGWCADAASENPLDDSSLLDSTVDADTTYYAKWMDAADDVAAVSFALPDELATGDEEVEAEVDVSLCTSKPTVKVTGLPPGLRFTAKDIMAKNSKTEVEYAANTIYGTPAKSGVYTVIASVTTAGKKTASCSQTVVVRKSGENVVKADVSLVDAEGLCVSEGTVPGKVTGTGVYTKGKKVTLKAAANRDFVFNGWYPADAIVSNASTCLSGLASYSFVMGDSDVALTAAFVKSEDDKASIDLTVNGLSFDTGCSGITPCIATSVYVGAYVEWPVEASALSATTVKVSGLPTGLKFAATPVVGRTTTGTGANRKTTVVTNVPANTIYGTPTVASKADRYGVVQPSKIVVTVTSAGRNVRKFTVDFTVLALPATCVGTFSGYAIARANTNATPAVTDETGWISLPCPFTATVDAKGALSGSLTALGKKLSFKATGYAEFDADDSIVTYGVAIPLKTLDKTWTESLNLALAVTPGEASLPSSAATLASQPSASPHFAVTAIDARRNAAKDTGYAALAKPYAGTYVATFDVPMSDGGTTGLVTVALTVDAKGGVRAAGTFVDATTFSASSAPAIAADGGSAEVLIPVTGKSFGSGGMLLAFGFAKGEDGTVTVAPLTDDGSPVPCVAKYVPKTARLAASYAAYDLLENATYACKANAWVGAALTKDDRLSVSYFDGETLVEALYAFTASKSGVVTGVGKTTNKSKLTFKLDAKTGLFTGANGKTKIFGALHPAVGGDATVSGLGSAALAIGGVSPVAVGTLPAD